MIYTSLVVDQKLADLYKGFVNNYKIIIFRTTIIISND